MLRKFWATCFAHYLFLISDFILSCMDMKHCHWELKKLQTLSLHPRDRGEHTWKYQCSERTFVTYHIVRSAKKGKRVQFNTFGQYLELDFPIIAQTLTYPMVFYYTALDTHHGFIARNRLGLWFLKEILSVIVAKISIWALETPKKA